MIVPLTLAHALVVAAAMRAVDRDEVRASGHDDLPAWCEKLVAMPGQDAVVWTSGGFPCAMGGGVVQGRVCTTWFVATDRLPEVARSVHRFTLGFHRRHAGSGVDVFQALSLDDHAHGRRWLARLGYVPHHGLMLNGRNFTLMRRFSHV